MLIATLTGLAAGAAHVLSGPDHLAAVGPLVVSRTDHPLRRPAWHVGLMWGIGHSGGVWLLAVLALVFREALPIDLLSAWGERVVGVVLIGVGLWGLRGLMGQRIHSHIHEHDGIRHVHFHKHDYNPGEHHPIEHNHTHGALGIGALHGLAGTSHLIGVLPALILPDRLSAVAYVAAYGLGAIGAMSAFAWAFGLAADRLKLSGDVVRQRLVVATCSAAILIGCYWCYSTWTPAPVVL